MQRRKQPQAAETTSKSKDSNPFAQAPTWKKAAIGILFLLIVLGALFASGTFDNIKLGPKIPIVRQAAEFALGMTLDEVAAKYKKIKKDLRPFNGDKDLRIVTLTSKEGYTGSSTADLLFYKDQLYFVSVMWSGLPADTQPIEEWAKQARRWKLKQGADPESLGPNVLLKEWRFNDGSTEMTLRDLKFNESRQRWQELRDATNQPAQTAFSKYRLETGG